ncbi:hypothetical protein [Candidatus Clostridium radicumherbarum]|uniref:Uncharacterized protein n=1 Tax=Candidatus Clostridium radicumherbarum TaxID=3381662 RepID=A0ABW8TUV5_9CLOT
MKEDNLKQVQNDINEALETIEEMENNLNGEVLVRDDVKEKFLFLTKKLTELESILKSEGII